MLMVMGAAIWDLGFGIRKSRIPNPGIPNPEVDG